MIKHHISFEKHVAVKAIVCCLLILISCRPAMAQIGAEAQGGKLTCWAALGIDYELSKRWSSVTDLGYGRHSDPDNTQFLKRLGLNVITQDFIYKMNEHWRLGLSAGYWRRNAYDDASPFDARSAPYEFRNELRPFQRLYYDHQLGAIKITHSIRLDERFYYNQDFTGVWTTPFEFRARYMANAKIPITRNNKNAVILSEEVLSAIDKRLYSDAWSPYQLTENRLSLYYRRSLNDQRVDIDLGIMHQYWRDRPGVSNFNVSYNIMFDVILHDPFRKKKEK